mmetsp:Transcript_11251/g.14823  ORF Transcript_11251/g.14823 Transcript_11251/m.14823 type:complete len:363 (-) Transcript_11251:67-1155(-)
MSRRSSRSRRSQVQEEEEEEQEAMVEEEEASPEISPSSPPRSKKNSSTSKRKRRSRAAEEEQEEEDNGDDDMMGEENEMMFSSQAPELTQEILPVRATDRNNLMKLGEEAREKAIQDLLRLILFKGLAGEPIDRTKVVKDSGIGDARISSAAFDEVNSRLSAIFDFKLVRVPEWMEKMKDFPQRLKDRYYLINEVVDEDGSHSRGLHATSEEGSIEKGLLMVVLGFVFCKGEPRSDGSRWLLDKDLYELLHKVDDNIHSEPPIQGMKQKRGNHAVAGTPDVDALLQKFVHMDYLLAIKASSSEQLQTMNPNADPENLFYAMGPRAAMEIGRKQVIFFCADSLDQEPDPSMLQEIEGDDEEEE